DGIRALTVAGVQTCALPISGSPRTDFPPESAPTLRFPRFAADAAGKRSVGADSGGKSVPGDPGEPKWAGAVSERSRARGSAHDEIGRASCREECQRLSENVS